MGSNGWQWYDRNTIEIMGPEIGGF